MKVLLEISEAEIRHSAHSGIHSMKFVVLVKFTTRLKGKGCTDPRKLLTLEGEHWI